MLKLVALVAAVVVTGGILLGSAGHSRAGAATAEPERFTTYHPPTGPELTVADVQSRAVAFARRAHQHDALTLTTAHATFAQAHVVMMGESLSAAQTNESGPPERAEEMRSPVWITMMTAPAGESFEPNNPTRRGHKAPSGNVLVVVVDAHTGFVKEEYLGATPPDIGLLGPTSTAQVPAEALAGESDAARASERLNPKLGVLAGVLKPPRVHRRVSIVSADRHRRAAKWSLPAGPETKRGSFSFRVLEGEYFVSAPGCGSRRVTVHGRRTVHVTLRCG
jgi:hypothetical protein